MSEDNKSQPAKAEESVKDTSNAGAADATSAKADIVPKLKPELDDATREALALRDEKSRKRPAFRRQEWFRYKKLGGKNAGWRKPRGIHSKARRHYKYRSNVVSIGYRGPEAARGLHPSGFEDVLVHNVADIEKLNPKTQAARVGGTVGGKKREAIHTKADELGVRVLNRRS